MSIYPGLSCKWSFTATYGVPSSPIIGKYFIGMDWLCGKKDNFILSCISFFLKTICWTGLKFLRVLESAYLSSSAPILLLLAEIHHFDSNNLFHFSWLYVLSKKSNTLFQFVQCWLFLSLLVCLWEESNIQNLDFWGGSRFSGFSQM